ncbi:hypothetical protein BHM03_00006364, partial [Ensete ventricosum]
ILPALLETLLDFCMYFEIHVCIPLYSRFSATSPPSFALEIFVHSEGESRFRRLCQPFLYSHSSSNVLEVEVTDYLLLYTLV